MTQNSGNKLKNTKYSHRGSLDFQHILDAIPLPGALVDKDFLMVTVNEAFYIAFGVSKEEVNQKPITNVFANGGNIKKLKSFLNKIFQGGDTKGELLIEVNNPERAGHSYIINAVLGLQETGEAMLLLTFKKKNQFQNYGNSSQLNPIYSILDHAPAYICILRGPQHIFELANTNYKKLVGGRELLGKGVKEALPEIENQGFIEMLDTVYQTGEPFLGNELPIQINTNGEGTKEFFLNFVYQPTYNSNGLVDGIFVHAVDVTELVVRRKQVEESEQELRNIIDTVPAMIWITDTEGCSVYLNKSWYEYTGQNNTAAEGYGWLEAVHPEDRKIAEDNFKKANRDRKPYSCTFRLQNKLKDYRWVIDSGRPKFNPEGVYQGMMGTVVDVHTEKLKEQVIREKELRVRSIVQEATVATALYIGEDMKIEIANEEMIRLWGKDNSIIGKCLKDALPELHGQPFFEILDKVFTTGKTYWGEEERVDLEINGKLVTGFFDFTYKPLRNEKGEIYGIINMAQNVSKIVASKKLLIESESHYRQMTNLLPAKVTNTNALGDYLYFNLAWLDYTGLSMEELKSTGWEHFIHPHHIKEFKHRWKNSLKTGENFVMEIKCRNKYDEYNWHLSRAEAVKDDAGNTTMWIGVTTNIQEQKEVMESLEYSTALLETYNQANFDGVLLVDTKGKILSYNQSFIDIWNMPQNIVDAKNDLAALEYADSQLLNSGEFLRTVKSIYESPSKINKEELYFKTGKIVERHGYPVIGKDGTFYAWSWTFRDITLQKNHEKNIEESELYYRQLADCMPDKITNASPNGEFIYYNKNWLDYSGLSNEELKKKGWISLIHPNEKKNFDTAWKKSLATGTNFEMELRCLNKDNKYKWHLTRVQVVKDEAGNVKMWIGSHTDIQKLKEEEKRKEDFLKMVSHELKTPITSIKGYVQLLLNIVNSRKEASVASLPIEPSLTRIDHQISRLTRLISEMLDLSRIEENKLELQKETFNINHLVAQTVEDINFTNTQHSIDIINKFECEVHADKDRIGQVLINFITNAIKYSPDSQNVVIIINNAGDQQVSVSVIDKGIGIDKKNHQKIFKRFYRISGKNKETFSGFGIGLYLANEIIHRHNGSIALESKEGEGSRFTFTLEVVPKNNI